MTDYNINLDEVDFADEMIRAIERDYGRSIARIAKFNSSLEPMSYDITLVFTDFRVLEATLKIVPFIFFDLPPQIEIEGIYY